MNDVANIIFLSLLGGAFALIGGIVFLYNRSWSHRLSDYSIPFASGVLITVSLLILLPESEHAIGEGAYMIVLLSFLAAYVFENLFFSIHHHSDTHHHGSLHTSIPLVIAGDTVHNFIDGVAIAAAYLVSPGLGLVTALSSFLHEVPHEIGDFGILLKAGWARKKILMVNLVSALATVIGALFVLNYFSDPVVIGVLMAIASGLFLYLGSSDFLPKIQDEDISANKALFALLLGVSVMIAVTYLVPHTHEEDADQIVDEYAKNLNSLLDS